MPVKEDVGLEIIESISHSEVFPELRRYDGPYG
jgi:hypothetical protein